MTTAQQPIRSTALKAGRLSMAHMRLAMLRRAGADDGYDDTPAMRWGRLVHMAVLQPAAMAGLPVWRVGRRAGAEWTAFAAGLPAGGEHLTPAELADLSTIGKSAAVAMAQLPAVQSTERLIEWTDDDYGVAACQPDAILADGSTVEVKTTARIDARAFASQAWSLGYPLQLGWYDHGARTAGLCGRRILLAIESAAPYSTALYEVGPAILREGYGEAYRIACAYRAAEAAGRFPGPYDAAGIMRFEPPKWAVTEAMEKDMSNGETMEASEL